MHRFRHPILSTLHCLHLRRNAFLFLLSRHHVHPEFRDPNNAASHTLTVVPDRKGHERIVRPAIPHPLAMSAIEVLGQVKFAIRSSRKKAVMQVPPPGHVSRKLQL